MKVFTLSLLCIVLSVAFTTATAEIEEDYEEAGFPSDEVELLSLSDDDEAAEDLKDDNEATEDLRDGDEATDDLRDDDEATEDLTDYDEATEDLSTERAARTPMRLWPRKAKKPTRKPKKPIRKPKKPIRKPTRRPRPRPTRGSIRKPTRKPKCPTVTFPCSRMPSVCANMRNAIRLGKPKQLTRTTDKSQIARNRRQSGCRSLGSKPGHNCDEYPFATSFQGGRGAVVKLVPIRENSIQGGTLSVFYKKHNIGHGDCFIVRV